MCGEECVNVWGRVCKVWERVYKVWGRVNECVSVIEVPAASVSLTKAQFLSLNDV